MKVRFKYDDLIKRLEAATIYRSCELGLLGDDAVKAINDLHQMNQKLVDTFINGLESITSLADEWQEYAEKLERDANPPMAEEIQRLRRKHGIEEENEKI